MKKLILVVACLSVSCQAFAQKIKTPSLAKQRQALRLGEPLFLGGYFGPENNEGIYADWKIIGFPPRPRADLVKHLLRLKTDVPEHYRMAVRQVKSFHWGASGGSYAWCREGEITLGARDYGFGNNGGDWFLMVIIHEIQHCNWPAHDGEDAASYAEWRYGSKLGLHPYYLNFIKAQWVRHGYNAQKWANNLAVTIRMNNEYGNRPIK